MEDPLCDSSLGSMVTLDYVTHLTTFVMCSSTFLRSVFGSRLQCGQPLCSITFSMCASAFQITFFPSVFFIPFSNVVNQFFPFSYFDHFFMWAISFLRSLFAIILQCVESLFFVSVFDVFKHFCGSVFSISFLNQFCNVVSQFFKNSFLRSLLQCVQQLFSISYSITFEMCPIAVYDLSSRCLEALLWITFFDHFCNVFKHFFSSLFSICSNTFVDHVFRSVFGISFSFSAPRVLKKSCETCLSR